MKNQTKRLIAAIAFLTAFAVWTLLVLTVDVRKIGPLDSAVGFAGFNQFVHNAIGVNMLIYTVTDWLLVVPVLSALCFAVLGLIQLIRRKSLLKVDRSLIALGVFYIAVIVAYLAFEVLSINYRPVLIDGILEASYPSTTTMVVMCVMLTAIIQIKLRIKNSKARRILIFSAELFASLMVIGRLLSGVHWVTDIIGSVLLSLGFVLLYAAFSKEK